MLSKLRVGCVHYASQELLLWFVDSLLVFSLLPVVLALVDLFIDRGGVLK
jgi:hypothetical protein